MKNKLFAVAAIFSVNAIAQQPPTGTPPANNTNAQAGAAWYRGGNPSTTNNNIFGTAPGFNSPIFTETNGINRSVLMANRVEPINGVNQVVNGFMGLGVNGWFGAINPNTGLNNSPWSMLHLDGPNNTTFGGAGWRKWMNTGTFMKENSDNMYIGMKSEATTQGTNRSDAIVSWSDDAFTAGGPLAQKTDGIELGRFDPTHGTFGVGNFQILAPNTYYSEPVRRVEILDADASTGLNANQPQLRTTYQYDPNPILGTFTEFQTTGLGDMYLNTRANTTTRFFGFHQPTPQNIVEINSQPNSPYNPANPQGSSGLRFTKLTVLVSSAVANSG